MDVFVDLSVKTNKFVNSKVQLQRIQRRLHSIYFSFSSSKGKNIYKRIERLFLQVDRQRKRIEQSNESKRRKQPKGKALFFRERFR